MVTGLRLIGGELSASVRVTRSRTRTLPRGRGHATRTRSVRADVDFHGRLGDVQALGDLGVGAGEFHQYLPARVFKATSGAGAPDTGRWETNVEIAIGALGSDPRRSGKTPEIQPTAT